MRKHLRPYVLQILAALAVPLSAPATLLVYEDFSYESGSLISGANGGTGFSSAWIDVQTGENRDAITGGLSYAGVGSSGNALSMTAPSTTGGTDERPITQILGTSAPETWLGFLVNLSSAQPVTSSDGAFISLRPNSSAPSPRVGVFWDGSALRFGLGASNSPTVNLASNPSLTLVPGETYFVVAQIIWNTATNTSPETINLFVNPDTTSTPTEAAATMQLNVALTSGTARDRITRVHLTAGAGNTEWIFDEIRLGTTYLDVVPEPPAVGLVGLALTGLGLLHFRRRKSA